MLQHQNDTHSTSPTGQSSALLLGPGSHHHLGRRVCRTRVTGQLCRADHLHRPAHTHACGLSSALPWKGTARGPFLRGRLWSPPAGGNLATSTSWGAMAQSHLCTVTFPHHFNVSVGWPSPFPHATCRLRLPCCCCQNSSRSEKEMLAGLLRGSAQGLSSDSDDPEYN